MVKKALLIGINYIGTDNELNGCINDIHNIKNFLTENCDFLDTDIKVLTDDLEENKPTNQNIKDNISWLVSNTNAGDVLVFYYSGHGSYIADTNKDESDRRDEVIVPLDFETSDFISDDWLRANMCSKINKNVILYCFSDSCHSGTICDLKYNCKSTCVLKKNKKVTNETYVASDWTEKFSYSFENTKDIMNGNVIVFSGCQDRETSADAYIVGKNQSQGAFTFCLLEMLNNNIDATTGKFIKNKIKLKSAIKEINCRLDIHGYGDQNSQLTTGKLNDINAYLNF